MDKWTNWHDSLPEHTKEYLKSQPLWHDADLFKALAIGLLIGIVIGVAL
jgi:hypothetical protein